LDFSIHNFLFAKSSLFKRLGGYLPFFKVMKLAIKNCHTILVLKNTPSVKSPKQLKINIFQVKNNSFSDEIQNKNV
jgi:hypothetical protein